MAITKLGKTLAQSQFLDNLNDKKNKFFEGAGKISKKLYLPQIARGMMAGTLVLPSAVDAFSGNASFGDAAGSVAGTSLGFAAGDYLVNKASKIKMPNFKNKYLNNAKGYIGTALKFSTPFITSFIGENYGRKIGDKILPYQRSLV